MGPDKIPKEIVVKEVPSYKYLGEAINNKGNLADQMIYDIKQYK